MEIEPTRADLAQVTRGRGGEFVAIEEDVQGIANDLHRIDPHLRLRYSVAGGYFVVYWKPDGEDLGNGELVTTAQELDQRLVRLVEKLYYEAQQPGYSFADALEAEEKRKRDERDSEFLEENVEAYERLAHAMRKELGYDKRKAFIGGQPDSGSTD